MTAPTWYYTDASGRVVRRDNADGSYESRLVSDAEVAAWIGAGNKPGAFVPPPKPPKTTMPMPPARVANVNPANNHSPVRPAAVAPPAAPVNNNKIKATAPLAAGNGTQAG